MSSRPTVALSLATALVVVTAAPAGSAPGAPAVVVTAQDVGSLTVGQITAGLAADDFSCVDLVQAYLERIAAYDDAGPRIDAVITTAPDALDRAADLDAVQEAGGDMGRGHCVPVVVKDVVDTADATTTYGSSLFADWLPEDDAEVVARMEAEGVVVLAKTNLDDFAAAVYGISSVDGPMRNPYDPARTVGGSSGGSAAAVAAGYAPLAVGTDTGGSLRIPAALTGVVTIRPTLGLVSRDGIFPRSLTQDTAGPIAGTVAGAALGLDLMAGYDPEDPVTARGVGQVPVDGYAAAADGGRLDGVRVGLVTGGLAIWGDQPDGPVVALLREAAADLEELGAEVVPMTAPPPALLGSPSVIGPESSRDATAFLQALGPDAPVSSFRELYDSGAYTPYAAEAFDREIAFDGIDLDADLGYQRALAGRVRLADWTLDQMARADVDAVAYPAAAQLADVVGAEQAGLFSRWSENTGFPALAVPMGLADPGTGRPLPAAMELLGRPFTETVLVDIADAYERSAGTAPAPPLPEIGVEPTRVRWSGTVSVPDLPAGGVLDLSTLTVDGVLVGTDDLPVVDAGTALRAAGSVLEGDVVAADGTRTRVPLDLPARPGWRDGSWLRIDLDRSSVDGRRTRPGETAEGELTLPPRAAGDRTVRLEGWVVAPAERGR